VTAPDRHLSWERFEDLITAGLPAVERVVGDPRVEIFTDPGGVRIGIRVFSDDPAPLTPLVEMDARSTVLQGRPAIEVSTSNRSLYREFYAFASAVADGVQIANLTPARAVDSAVASWAALLERLAILSPERQTGLSGELWTLKRLAGAQGWVPALRSWNGPDAEEHDFALQAADVEVKTTVSERRAHMIGSLTQLLAKPGRSLYILSLQYTRAGIGPGKTLTDAVADVRAAVSAQSPALMPELEARLERSGWRAEHGPYYRTRWALRNAARLVTVDEACPSIVPGTLASMGASLLSRIVQVSYRIDLEGLGVEDGSPEFCQVLP
jgi:hypothetical protein